MANKINKSYKLNKDDISVINRYFTCHTDWSKSNFNDLKQSLITHLREEQKNKCCYCKRELGFDLKEVEIEHIIPKGEYECFTFHMKNLSLSCPGCNTSKHADQVLYNPVVKYPRTGKNFKIVHPHFDDYDLHIAIHYGSIYEGLDAKGHNTLSACNISRLRKVIQRQREADLNNGSLTYKLINALTNATPEQRQDLENLLESMFFPKVV